MSQSDPIVFAARAARMGEAELFAELQRFGAALEVKEWRQAIEDELLFRHLVPSQPAETAGATRP